MHGQEARVGECADEDVALGQHYRAQGEGYADVYCWFFMLLVIGRG